MCRELSARVVSKDWTYKSTCVITSVLTRKGYKICSMITKDGESHFVKIKLKKAFTRRLLLDLDLKYA